MIEASPIEANAKEFAGLSKLARQIGIAQTRLSSLNFTLMKAKGELQSANDMLASIQLTLKEGRQQ